MAYIQRTTPPPNRIMSFTLKNFTGGLNNRSEILEPNQASDLLNMSFANDTIMERRKGSKYFDDTCLSEPIVYLDEFKPYNDTNKMISATLSSLYVDKEFICGVNGQINGVNFNGAYYFTDGDKLYVYGKFHQSEGTYQKITGEPIADYIVLQITNPPDGFEQLDPSHTQGIRHVDYSERKIWYEPCKLEVEDTFKGFNVIPDRPQFITVHQGRLFVSGAESDNDNVYITDTRNGLYFPVSLPIQLPPNSDKVTGLIVYDDSVVVGRNYDIYSITGMTNNPELGYPLFRLRKINSHTGFINQRSVHVVHNYLFYLGYDGNAYSMSSARNDEKILSTTIISRSLDLFSTPLDFSREDLSKAIGYFHDDLFYISIKDKILVYSYRNQAWTLYNNLDVHSFYHIDHQLIWGNGCGRTVMFSDDYFDLGLPYRSFWTSKNFDMDDASAFKQFREFYVVAHTYNDKESEIRMTFEVDYVDVKENVGLSDMISIYGRAKFGDRFITRNIHASEPFTIGRRGRTIRFRFANGYFITGEVETIDDLSDITNRRNNILYKVTSENAYYVYRLRSWYRLEEKDLNQPMKVYQISGEYEIRGKR